MIIQLGNKDNAKDIIEVENINMKGEDISPDIELLRSQFLFEKAIQLINFNVSFYAKGQFLTEEK